MMSLPATEMFTRSMKMIELITNIQPTRTQRVFPTRLSAIRSLLDPAKLLHRIFDRVALHDVCVNRMLREIHILRGRQNIGGARTPLPLRRYPLGIHSVCNAAEVEERRAP